MKGRFSLKLLYKLRFENHLWYRMFFFLSGDYVQDFEMKALLKLFFVAKAEEIDFERAEYFNRIFWHLHGMSIDCEIDLMATILP